MRTRSPSSTVEDQTTTMDDPANTGTGADRESAMGVRQQIPTSDFEFYEEAFGPNGILPRNELRNREQIARGASPELQLHGSRPATSPIR